FRPVPALNVDNRIRPRILRRSAEHWPDPGRDRLGARHRDRWVRLGPVEVQQAGLTCLTVRHADRAAAGTNRRQHGRRRDQALVLRAATTCWVTFAAVALPLSLPSLDRTVTTAVPIRTAT